MRGSPKRRAGARCRSSPRPPFPPALPRSRRTCRRRCGVGQAGRGSGQPAPARTGAAPQLTRPEARPNSCPLPPPCCPGRARATGPRGARHAACPGGGIGRRTSFRCWRSKDRGGSSSSPGHHPSGTSNKINASVGHSSEHRQRWDTFQRSAVHTSYRSSVIVLGASPPAEPPASGSPLSCNDQPPSD